MARTGLTRGHFASDDPRDVVGELQRMGVLAQADQQMIEGGTFRLTADELEGIARFERGEWREGTSPLPC